MVFDLHGGVRNNITVDVQKTNTGRIRCTTE